jgi:hypothetical protein
MSGTDLAILNSITFSETLFVLDVKLELYYQSSVLSPPQRRAPIMFLHNFKSKRFELSLKLPAPCCHYTTVRSFFITQSRAAVSPPPENCAPFPYPKILPTLGILLKIRAFYWIRTSNILITKEALYHWS